MNFTTGDVLKKRKPPNRYIYYFITNAYTEDGDGKYEYAMYRDTLFQNHHGYTKNDSEYIDRLVGDDLNYEKTDYNLGQYAHEGHILEMQERATITSSAPGWLESEYLQLSFAHLKEFNANGFEAITPGWLFYETAGTKRILQVDEAGHSVDRLADDMLRLRDNEDDDVGFVEVSSRVTEALKRGLWVPVKATEKKIDGTKETRI